MRWTLFQDEFAVVTTVGGKEESLADFVVGRGRLEFRRFSWRSWQGVVLLLLLRLKSELQ
jgi:hypothetical protein